MCLLALLSILDMHENRSAFVGPLIPTIDTELSVPSVLVCMRLSGRKHQTRHQVAGKESPVLSDQEARKA